MSIKISLPSAVRAQDLTLVVLLVLFVLYVLGMIIIPLSLALEESGGRLFIAPQTQSIFQNEFVLSIKAEAEVPVNAFAGVIEYDPNTIEVVAVDYHASIADLWVEAPMPYVEEGLIRFSGGTTARGGFTGIGTLFSATFRLRTGSHATIKLTHEHMLKSDGLGTSVALDEQSDAKIVLIEPIESTASTLYGESEVRQRPIIFDGDVNGDGVQNFSDFSAYMEHVRTNDQRADMNGDGRIDTVDFHEFMQLVIVQ